MYTLTTVYTNRYHYRTTSSLMAANLVAINILRNEQGAKAVYITDSATGEILNTYTR